MKSGIMSLSILFCSKWFLHIFPLFRLSLLCQSIMGPLYHTFQFFSPCEESHMWQQVLGEAFIQDVGALYCIS